MSKIHTLKFNKKLVKRKGFSLIELVIVILVIGIASLGLATVVGEVLFNLHRPQVITTAMGLAEAEAERVMALSFPGVINENRDSPASYSGNFSSYSRQVRVDSLDTAAPGLGSDPAMADYKVVDVRVHHVAIGNVSIVFLRTNY